MECRPRERAASGARGVASPPARQASGRARAASTPHCRPAAARGRLGGWKRRLALPFPSSFLVPLEEVTFRSRCPFENVDFGKDPSKRIQRRPYLRGSARHKRRARGDGEEGGGRGCTEHCEVRVLRLRDMRGSAAARAGRGVRGEPPLRVSTYNACLPERGHRGAPRALPGEVYKFEERIQQAFRCSAGLPHTLVWRACLRFTSSSAPDASNFRIGLGPPVTTRPGVYMS